MLTVLLLGLGCTPWAQFHDDEALEAEPEAEPEAESTAVVEVEPEARDAPPAPACPAAITSLWSTKYDYGAHGGFAIPELLGVATDHRRAWLAHGVGGSTYTQPGSMRTIIEVDLVERREVDRFVVEPTFDAAGMPRHVPALGPLWPTVQTEADLPRFGAIAREVAAWQGHGWFPVVTTPDGRHLLHTRWPDRADLDADWLALRTADGRDLGRAEPAVLRAVYDPTFSPDGRFLAYRGCRRYPGQGCLYDTYVEPFEAHRRPSRSPASAFAGRGPLQGEPIGRTGRRGEAHRFGPDGAHLFVLVRHDRETCVYRVKATASAHERWVCIDGESQDRVGLLTAGERGLLASARMRSTGGQDLETTLVWFSLRERADERRIVRDDLGLPARMRPDGVVVGHRFVIDPTGWTAQLDTEVGWTELSHFADDGTIVGLHSQFASSSAGTAELVRLDPDTLRRGCPQR